MRHKSVRKDFLAAVRAAAMLRMDARFNGLADFRRAIYIGLYAGRATSINELSKFLTPSAGFDAAFVRWATKFEKVSPDFKEFPTLVNRSGKANIQVSGVIAQCLTEGESSHVRIEMPSVYLRSSPGFICRHHGFSALRLDKRFYLSINPRDARWFLDEFFGRLRTIIPSFSMKTLANPRAYFRADAAVVYVSRDEMARASFEIERIVREAGIRLRSKSPLGAYPLANGISWADSPDPKDNTEQSFGQWISELIEEVVETANGNSFELWSVECLRAKGRCLDTLYEQTARAKAHS